MMILGVTVDNDNEDIDDGATMMTMMTMMKMPNSMCDWTLLTQEKLLRAR